MKRERERERQVDVGGVGNGVENDEKQTERM